jgi:transcription-repair coupling factor (superfamily II helicase)
MKPETVIDADIEALIPDFYIESDTERLDIYRRLYKTIQEEELVSMREELKDRFGEYPEEVENLFQLVELRLLVSRAGFPKVSLKENVLTITLPDESNKQFYGLPADQAGETNDDNSPFQRLMKKIAHEKKKDVQMKQVGKDLQLSISGIQLGTTIEKLKEANKKIEEIIAVV